MFGQVTRVKQLPEWRVDLESDTNFISANHKCLFFSSFSTYRTNDVATGTPQATCASGCITFTLLHSMATAVFVTGASGYIGQHVAIAFRNAGYRVYGLVRSQEKGKGSPQ